MSFLRFHNHHRPEDYTLTRLMYEVLTVAEELDNEMLRASMAGRAAQAGKPSEWKKWMETFTGTAGQDEADAAQNSGYIDAISG